MKSKKTTGTALLLSFLTYCALSMNLDPVSEENGLRSLVHYLSQFNGFSIAGVILFAGLFLLFQKTVPTVHGAKLSSLKSELILAALFALFVVIGISFEKTGSAILLYGLKNGQILKAATVFIGYFLVFFYGVRFLFCWWTQYSEKESISCGSTVKSGWICSHPFLFAFLVLFAAYLPRAIISFPGISMGDTPWQIAQAFPGQAYSHVAQNLEDFDYFPAQSKLLSENVFINQHHPVAHTLLLHACICLGHGIFKSWNAGLYINTLLQEVVFLAAVSYAIAALVRKKVVSEKYVWFLTAYFFIHPYIHSFVFLTTKDTFYAAFFVLFLTHWFLLLKEDCDKKDICILFVSAIGMLLFRNEAKDILPVLLLLSVIVNKATRKTALLLTGTIAVFVLLVFHVLFPALDYSPGSIREMLSVPFQQTARYVSVYQDEVTEQEREAIDRVLDYDALAEYYDPNKSDAVRGTYRETADAGDLKQYFKCWLGMFFKHPETYFAATANNYYEYVYPSTAKPNQYTYRWSNQVMKKTNSILEPIGVEFSHPAKFDGIRHINDAVFREIKNVPVISLIMTPACYVWVILLILFYSIKTKARKLISLIALPFFTVLVCFLGPTNGSYTRYLFPIIVAMPLLIPMAIALTKQERYCDEPI